MAKTTGMLQTVAREMRNDLLSKEQGWKLHQLPRGLKLLLSRIDGQWRLALAREQDFPSDAEVQICMAAFNVPEGVEPVKVTKEVPQGAAAVPVQYGIVELRWREIFPEGVQVCLR